MEHEFCPTMWSTHDVKGKEKFNGRRHGCRFPKDHKGGICLCVCGKAHRNLTVKEDAPATM